MTYVAHDGKNALTAYATSRDLKKFSKKGIISPRIKYHDAETIFEREDLKDAYILFSSYYENREGHDVLLWHKDFILFPKKIRGNFVALHRVLPDIQIVSFRNFSTLTNEFWKREFRNFSKRVVLQNTHWFETRNIGGGAVPLETKKGWIVIYHGVEETNAGRIYHASAILLDLNDPRKVIGKLHSPLFSPTKPWEKKGLVPNIVFPTANAVFNNTLYIYYSAADSLIAVAAVNLNSLLRELLNPKRKHNNNEE